MPENNGEIRSSNGQFAPGNPGRPKGTVIKTSIRVREAIINFLEGNIDKIQDDFDKVKPRERLQFIADILPYSVPKLSAVQTENNTNIGGEVLFRWVNPRSHADLRPSGKDEGDGGESLGLRRRIPDNL